MMMMMIALKVSNNWPFFSSDSLLAFLTTVSAIAFIAPAISSAAFADFEIRILLVGRVSVVGTNVTVDGV